MCHIVMPHLCLFKYMFAYDTGILVIALHKCSGIRLHCNCLGEGGNSDRAVKFNGIGKLQNISLALTQYCAYLK